MTKRSSHEVLKVNEGLFIHSSKGIIQLEQDISSPYLESGRMKSLASYALDLALIAVIMGVFPGGLKKSTQFLRPVFMT